MKVTLPPILDIHHAAALLENTKSWGDSRGHLYINASSVERVTTPALQILLALLTYRRNHRRPASIQAPTDAFIQAIATLGLEPFFKEHLVHG